MAPNGLGRFARVVEVYGRGTDINGRPYVCYYVELSDTGMISMSVKADIPIESISGKYTEEMVAPAIAFNAINA